MAVLAINKLAPFNFFSLYLLGTIPLSEDRASFYFFPLIFFFLLITLNCSKGYSSAASGNVSHRPHREKRSAWGEHQNSCTASTEADWEMHWQSSILPCLILSMQPLWLWNSGDSPQPLCQGRGSLPWQAGWLGWVSFPELSGSSVLEATVVVWASTFPLHSQIWQLKNS